MIFWMLLSVVLVVLIGLMVLYNGLVHRRQLVREGWSGISVQLQRRADLIPNLLAAVQGYMTHEQDLLSEVTALRVRAQALGEQHPAERAAVEGLLGAALSRLIAVAENYPDLKASANFLELQESLETIEGELQLARRYYNGAARQYNIAVEQFPSNLVAGEFGFAPAEFFTLDDPADAAVPKVSFARGTPP
jgi:LemA protein